MSEKRAAKPRIGHRMRELQAIVSAVPGISKSDALRVAGLPVHGLGSGRELNRAIAAGLVIVEHEHARRCRLFASDRDRRRWHLAREALTQGTPARRVAKIRAEDRHAGRRARDDLEDVERATIRNRATLAAID